MPFLIDSDWLIDHLARVPEATALIDSLAGDGVLISVVSYMEAFQGTLRESDPQNSATRLAALVNSIPVLEMTIPIAERAARIRQHFLDLGQRPARRGFDIVIAATAIEYDLTLVTRNVRDYADIPGITLYQAAGSA